MLAHEAVAPPENDNSDLAVSAPGDTDTSSDDDASGGGDAPADAVKDAEQPLDKIDGPGIIDHEPCDVEEIARHELTEDALAELFVSRRGDRLRHDHDRHHWYVWNEMRWEEDKTGLVFDLVRRHARGLHNGRIRMATRKAIDGIETMASRDRRVAVASGDWDSDPWLLGTPGGYLDLKTAELREPDPKDLVTKLTAVTPAAKCSPCPCFMKFLDQATGGDEGLKRFLQQSLDYCLTGRTNEQVLLFIYGPGGDGKSVLQDGVVAIIGEYATTAAMETFSALRY